MKKILSACIGILLIPCLWASAQQSPASSATGGPSSFIRLPLHNDLKPENPGAWLREHYQANPDFHLQFVSKLVDVKGNEHYKYKQFYKGVPVEKTMVNVHCKGNVPYLLNGNFYTGLTVSFDVSFSEEEALKKALSLFPANTRFAWEDPLFRNLPIKASTHKTLSAYPKAEMVIYVQRAPLSWHYAYKFDIQSLNPFSRKIVYVDPVDGRVLGAEEQMTDIDKPGIAHTRYSGVQNIVCDSDVVYSLAESGRGNGIATLNAKPALTGADPVVFEDDDNVWNNVNVDMDEVATDVHWGLEKTYDFYQSVLSRNSIDDAGHELIGLVHMFDPSTGGKMANAFWSGAYAFFGDGNDTSMFPLTSIDVVGHEISHGLTQHTAGLEYMNESGALNESFSDIIGTCIERYALPSSYDWLMGAQIVFPGKSAMRNMADPNSRKHPKYYKGLHYYTGIEDNGGVHTNSGVQNFWFYLLCEGGTGTRESDAMPYDVDPIGWDAATQIAYTNLSAYLSPYSEYSDAASGSFEAAKLLYGDSSKELYNVQMAWYAVGLMEKPAFTPKDPTSIQLQLVDKDDIYVYPNPAKDHLLLNAGRPLQEATVSLMTSTGLLLQKIEDYTGGELSVDVSALPVGLYLIEIRDRQAVKHKKFVKQ